MDLRLDLGLLVERAHESDYCHEPTYVMQGPYLRRVTYGCRAETAVSIGRVPFCARHGEARLAHSLFEALERALERRVQLQEAR